MRNSLSFKHIRGAGIEIGGLHFPLPVSEGVQVKYIDRLPVETLRAQNPTLDIKTDSIIVDSAETLATVPDASQDFVIANHVLEHCENPLLALQNWRRVLKPNGVVYAAIPNKDHTFDIKRKVTTFGHIFKDYADGPDWSLKDHYTDWYTNSTLEGLEGDKLEAQVNAAIAIRANVHFHVWDEAAIRFLADTACGMFDFKSVEYHSHGCEVIVILKA